MFHDRRLREPVRTVLASAILFAVLLSTSAGRAQNSPAGKTGVMVGTQYDTTHVYVAPDQMDALVNSFIATFGGHATARITTNVLPVPSSTESQAVLTPSGNLSVFAFLTPVPFPFGQERNGYLVTDMDQAVKAAKQDGAEVIVTPFQDPIGRDAVIQWPGGVKMQLYWHTTPPSSAPLQSVPESRVYVSSDRADEFVRDIVRFGHGKVVSDDGKANAEDIGRPGETFRRIEINSGLGVMRVLVTNGHLPYPFGYERTGYQVPDLNDTLAKAKAAGAQVLSGPHTAKDRTTAIIEFPGGYIAEIHTGRN
jgi:predicted enzyme related to lactoylglutathione lyase